MAIHPQLPLELSFFHRLLTVSPTIVSSTALVTAKLPTNIFLKELFVAFSTFGCSH
jgi:hypothetical protein